jgi:hypothetical protein
MAAAAAAVIVIAVGLAAVFAPMGPDDPVVEEPVPQPPPITTVISTPEAAPQKSDDASPISWTRITDPLFTDVDGRIESLAFTEHGLMAAGSAGRDAAVWKSPDEQTWKLVDDPDGVFGPAHSPYGGTGLRSIQGLASKDGRTIAVGFEIEGDRPGGSRPMNQADWAQLEPVAAVWYTDDGTVWQRVDHDPERFAGEGANRMLSVAASDDWYLAVGDGMWRSRDGVVWERLVDPDGRLWDVIATRAGFMAAGPDPSDMQVPGIWSSVDGMVWESASVDSNRLSEGIAHRSVAYALTSTDYGYFATGVTGNAGTLDGVVWQSADGHTWELTGRIPLGKWEWLAGVAAQGSKAVAVGTQEWNGAVGLVWESSDHGVTWSLTRDPMFGIENGWDWTVVFDAVAHNGRMILGGSTNDHPAIWVGEWIEQEGK